MKLRYDNLERRSKAFSLFIKCKRKESMLVGYRRCGRSGIACDDDEPAIRWQQIQMRLNILETYLLGEIAPNWFNARWLTNEQASQRNKSYSPVA